MMVKIVVVVVVVIAVVLILAAVKPATIRIQRSVVIDAPPEKVFPLIDNLQNWSRWNPQDQEPATTHTFTGPASGAGAAAEWNGKGNAGAGRMLITESAAPAKVTVQVDWARPFKAQNINEFALSPEGNATRVIWSMRGPNLYIMRLMDVFTSMDRVMGKHFEAGLGNLKTAAEK